MRSITRQRPFGRIALSALLLLVSGWTASLHAQATGGPSAEPVNTEVIDDGGLTLDEQQSEGLSLLWLISQGGFLMLPIYFASIVTIAVVIERFISLRRSKVLPPSLLAELIPRQLDAELDPRDAYALCQRYPSAAANVIRTMLLKVGRPHAEVERAVAEASQREADRMYANVRWLNLVAAVTPLLGLLGTVWGMIRAFFDTTQLAIGQNKADFLAAGIYVALVTTLSGLTVAIPAAVLAHYFEGRIQRVIHSIEELLFNLLPHVERYEGRLRLNATGAYNGDSHAGPSDSEPSTDTKKEPSSDGSGHTRRPDDNISEKVPPPAWKQNDARSSSEQRPPTPR